MLTHANWRLQSDDTILKYSLVHFRGHVSPRLNHIHIVHVLHLVRLDLGQHHLVAASLVSTAVCVLLLLFLRS